jgi:hypothetical protein
MPCFDATYHSCLWPKGAYFVAVSVERCGQPKNYRDFVFATNICILEFLNMTTFAIALTATLLGACVGIFSIALVALAARPNRSTRGKDSCAGHAHPGHGGLEAAMLGGKKQQNCANGSTLATTRAASEWKWPRRKTPLGSVEKSSKTDPAQFRRTPFPPMA